MRLKMRRRSLVLLGLGVVAGLVAGVLALGDTGGDAAGARPRVLTPPELRWIRGYARWAIEVYDAELGKPAVRAGLSDCDAVLRTDAGPAPTPRLREIEPLVQRACAALVAREPEERVLERLSDADDRLEPLLLSSVSLRETDDATVESRHAPALSAVASSDVGGEVEVQCWSERDWGRVIRENNAWADTHDEAAWIDGMAYWDSGRIYLLLGDCNVLGRLRHERIRDRTREGLIAAADALATFSHEIQHFVLPDATEAKVECAGAQALAHVGRALGVDGDEIQLLRSAYAESIRPQLSREYRVGACAGF